MALGIGVLVSPLAGPGAGLWVNSEAGSASLISTSPCSVTA